MLTKETALKKIAELVERFEEQYASYKKADYNETLTRRDFIDPFFKALGWDIDNENGYAESYREVIHEDRVKVGKATKAPDYSFRLVGGKRLFFVEAKKPNVDVKVEIQPAYQVRRYGWSAKLPISIITDFEEFAIYDCTKKPLPTDKSSVARVKYLTFREYLKEFDFIWDTFSKERVLKGSFDKFVQGNLNKKGTATVDKEFLQSLDSWRTYLATSISWNNKDLNEDEINFVVQQTIDRIIFLRIAEDRSIEPYGNLQLTIKQGDFYKNLFHQFQQADDKYNSGLFDFKKDKISKTLSVDNKVLKTIINELYYPESPYEFSVLSVEILGSAYEQFLGKQIKIDKAHRAHIEEKPEVRKAGGVYYTPQYIVEYIVKNTVGKLTENKTPKEISTIKIVDPACGSGSFLIGAYQYLLDWHKDYYTDNGKVSKGTKGNPLTPDGHLTTSEKKRILLNNIFGVDIDVNAVEVTKLSLLLKCLEGETEASIASQMKLFNERVLPTLDSNIKDGNSLVDTDFYGGELDFGEEKKVKPFSWKSNFEEVLKKGGFDVVIGNPPYVRQELLGTQKNYFLKKYKVYHSVADLYTYFFERGIELLNEKGLFGIIVANKWMRANYGEPLRKWVKNQNIKQIIDFGDLPVFQNVSTYPCIFICGNGKSEKQITVVNVKTLQFESLEKYVSENKIALEQNSLNNIGWNLSSDLEQNLLNKLIQVGIPLGKYVKEKIYYGIKTGFNEAFVINEATKEKLVNEHKSSAELIKPFLGGRDIKRYQTPVSDKFLISIPKGFTNDKGKNPKNAWKWLQENYSAIANHLKPFKEACEKRQDKGDFWWELRACDYYEEFGKPKIMIPDIALSMQALYDDKNFYCVNTAYIIPVNDKFLLGILNSNLVQYYYSKISSSIQGGYFRFIRQYLETIPISRNVKLKIEIEKLVNQLLQLNQQNSEAKLSTQVSQIQGKIDFFENRLNQMVYQLYDLTEEEIKIVEGNG
ncbi:MAG: N-6 DNA methylase [Bacteroidia bacterium]|nr:N-6 DNA methylase [Bacteroidota bacterium]MBP9922613.1 N-6 DNA methylase [Bacteroidia bacterium]